MFSELAAILAKLPINKNYASALLTGYGLNGVTIVVQLVLVPLYLNYLGTEKFGVLAMILAANNFAAIGIGWLSGGIARVLGECAALNDSKSFKTGYAFAKWLYLLYISGAIIIFWVIAPIFIDNITHDNEIKTALILASIYLIFIYEYNADRLAFSALHWQAKNNLREIVGQLVFAISGFAFLSSGFGLSSVIGAQILGILVTRMLAWYYWRHNDWKLQWMLPTTDHKALWHRVTGKMGRDYIIYGALILTLQADALFLGWILGPETVARYYLVWRIPEVIILLLWRIPGSYAPFLIDMDAKGEFGKLQKNYKKGLNIMFLLAGAAALLYGLVGQYFVNWWIGDMAPRATFPYLVAAVAMFFLAVTRWPSSVAYSMLNTTPLIRITAVELLAKLLILVLLFDKFDFITPIVATVIVHAFLVFYLYLALGMKTVRVKRL